MIGLASGLGAATTDRIHAVVAAFGLTADSDVLFAQRRPLGIVGGAFLARTSDPKSDHDSTIVNSR